MFTHHFSTLFGFAIWIYIIFLMSNFFHDALAFTSSTTTSIIPRSSAILLLQDHQQEQWRRNHKVTIVGRKQQTKLFMAQVSQAEAQKGIDKVVTALRKDKEANTELGKLTKVNNILGFGSPRSGILAVRFNASFQKGGFGLSSVPLPFGMGQSDKSEGRGTMVGQVKASIDAKSGKIVECSVFRDLGYGRAFNLNVRR